MTNFIFAPLFGAAANLLVACFIFLRSPRQRLNQVYLVWGISLAVWCSGAGALFFVDNARDAMAWARVLHFGVIWIPVTGLHVCLLMARKNGRRFLLLCYAITLLLTFGNIVGAHITGVEKVSYGWFAQAGLGFWLFGTFMPVATVPAIAALYFAWRSAEPGQKRKYPILIAANSLLLVTGTHDLMPVLGYFTYPGTDVVVYPWGTYAAGFYGLLVAYGVLQDQILDVRVTLSRYAALTVRLGFFVSAALLLLIIAAAIGPEGKFSPYAFLSALAVIVIAAIATGTLFPKLFGGLGEGLERKLLGDRFEYYEQVRAVADGIHRHTKLETMWHDVADVLQSSMGATPIHCLLLGARKFSVAFRGTLPGGNGTGTFLEELPAECAIIRFLETETGALDVKAGGDLLEKPHEREALREATMLKAEYVFALRGAGRVLGFVALGRKTNGADYNALDLELMNELTRRMGWATERTLLAGQVGFAERHELLGMMARGLAHDLNNLLTPVSTVLQLSAPNFGRGSREERLLEAAHTSLRTIRNYVEEAIFFAKDLKPRMTAVPLAEILDEVAAVCRPRAERRGVLLALHAEEREVVVDGVLCQRMLGNLVANAIDASAEGGTVQIEARVEDARGIAQFRVIDHGSGISPENLTQVFRPYFTTKDTGDNGERGFGLGLAVCQLIVELHQGVISLASEVGKGTTVTVELPRDGAGQPTWLPTHHIF